MKYFSSVKIDILKRKDYFSNWLSKETRVDWSRPGNGAALPKGEFLIFARPFYADLFTYSSSPA